MVCRPVCLPSIYEQSSGLKGECLSVDLDDFMLFWCHDVFWAGQPKTAGRRHADLLIKTCRRESLESRLMVSEQALEKNCLEEKRARLVSPPHLSPLARARGRPSRSRLSPQPESNGEVCPGLRILPFLFCSTTQGFLLFYLSPDSPS